MRQSGFVAVRRSRLPAVGPQGWYGFTLARSALSASVSWVATASWRHDEYSGWRADASDLQGQEPANQSGKKSLIFWCFRLLLDRN
jgi:hypothetical protein